MISWIKRLFQTPRRRRMAQIAILIMVSIGSLAIILTPLSIRPSVFPFSEGGVSSQDIQAPHALAYVSKILTEQAQTTAFTAVEPIYQPADPGITRTQIENLRSVLNFITNIKLDSYSDTEQKQTDLHSITGINLSDKEIITILSFSEVDWQNIQQEALKVLEQVMRATIRESSLQDALRNVPALISLSLPQEEANIVSAFVIPFITPNSLLSVEQTEAARKSAMDSVQPVTRSYATGEIIVRRGQVISPLTWEALGQFDLIQPEDNTKNIISTVVIVTLLAGFNLLYFRYRPGIVVSSLRYLVLISLLFLLFFALARFFIPNRVVVPYLFPLAAFCLTISCIFSIELGIVFSITLGILTAFNLSNSLDLTVFYILTSMVGVLSLGKAQRIQNFILSGMLIGLCGAGVILAYRLPGTIDLAGLATLVGAAFFNGLASASLTVLLQYFISQLLGLTTPMQLLELQRPDHPLSKFILQNSPGTYQHSLQVANLAEQAAEAIGADPLLTRVGAIYHDAGKASNPSFFVENQIAGNNPHDALDPFTSAEIIHRHVTDGVELGKKYRLPRRLHDFMLEHHGTLITRYQYARAVQAVEGDESKVDMEFFRYPGPRPKSRETALLMLADSCEARVRANPPKDEQTLREIIQQAFDYVQQQHQLDDTRLSIKDLSLTAESFFHTLKNMYHPRIPYPELKKAVVPESDNQQLEINPESK
jgi:putative nucleotidyltransferase with HDIG domain